MVACGVEQNYLDDLKLISSFCERSYVILPDFRSLAVAKCLSGTSFQHYRAEKGRLIERQAAADERAKRGAQE